ncbi:YopX family protein [Parapedobacter soli]|uniref:YopX family protein n=1 Tax=Parapedobacter soli TaxID=416955 RepID=UPI0021C68C3C|nr:YopX family protein [Parapedobacter soli]
MTREILFRGKRTTNGQLVEGFYIERHNIKEILTQSGTVPVIPATVGQYTGKNCTVTGEKIFTHDIVRDYRGDTYHVVYDAHYAAFMLKSSLTYSGSRRMEGSYERVGNIFDDPFIEPEPQGREQPSRTPSSESFSRRNQKEAMKGLTNKQ